MPVSQITAFPGALGAFEDIAVMLVASAGFVLIFIALALPRFMRKQMAQEACETPAEVRQHEMALARVESSLLELEEASREIFGRLDTRTRALIRLIEKAEVQSRQLEDALNRRA